MTSRLKTKFVPIPLQVYYWTDAKQNYLLHDLHSMARSQISCGGVRLKLQTCIRKETGFESQLSCRLSVCPNKHSVVFLANMSWSSSFKYLTTDHPRPHPFSVDETDLTSKFTERLCITWSSRQRETALCGSAGLRCKIECTHVMSIRVEHWDYVVSSGVRDYVSQARYHNRKWWWPF